MNRMVKAGENGAETPRAISGTAATAQFLPPLKPRPHLFAVLGVVLAAWVVALLVLYFVTVWPHRHEVRGSHAGLSTSVNL